MDLYYAYDFSKDYFNTNFKLEKMDLIERDGLKAAFEFIFKKNLKKINIATFAKQNLNGHLKEIIGEKNTESLCDKKFCNYKKIYIGLMTERIPPLDESLPILACYFDYDTLVKFMKNYPNNTFIYVPSSKTNIDLLLNNYKAKNII